MYTSVFFALWMAGGPCLFSQRHAQEGALERQSLLPAGIVSLFKHSFDYCKSHYTTTAEFHLFTNRRIVLDHTALKFQYRSSNFSLYLLVEKESSFNHFLFSFPMFLAFDLRRSILEKYFITALTFIGAIFRKKIGNEIPINPAFANDFTEKCTAITRGLRAVFRGLCHPPSFSDMYALIKEMFRV